MFLCLFINCVRANPGRYTEAYDGFLKLQKMQPKNHELYVAAGQALQKTGNSEGALSQFQKAISVIQPKVV